MKNDIKKYMRYNRPVVKEGQEFMLELNRRLQDVEWLKEEMDIQQRKRHHVLICTFALGFVIGILILTIDHFHPVIPEALDMFTSYIMFPVSLFTTVLGIYFAARDSSYWKL